MKRQDEAFRPFINSRFPHLLHGADYNPDQWMAVPGALDEDVRLMRLAGCNVMSVGIFAWSRLEPREGVYDFGWLDETMDRLAEAGVAVMLATPSGARPLWMSLKYPEVNRRLREGRRVDPGRRHDHCPTSPVYREACVRVNTRQRPRDTQIVRNRQHVTPTSLGLVLRFCPNRQPDISFPPNPCQPTAVTTIVTSP